MSNQKLTSGHNSNNTQISGDMIIQQGITFADARQIAIDVVKSEIEIFQNSASKIIKERIDHIASGIAEEVRLRLKGDFSIFGDPDFQYVLYNVGISFARSGNESLEELLIKLVGERAVENSRSTKQSILNEAIEICGKMTEGQLKILASIFIPAYTIMPAKNLNELGNCLNQSVAGPLNDFNEDELEYNHLEFLRCISVRTAINVDLVDHIRNSYALFFVNKLAVERFPINLKKYLDDDALFFYSDDRLKVSPTSLNATEFKKLLTSKNVPEQEIKLLDELYGSLIFNKDITKNMIIDVSPDMKIVFEKWGRSGVERWQLTSVGKVLAVSYLRHLRIDLDYGTWLK